MHFSADDTSSQLLDVFDAATHNAAVASAIWLATHPAWQNTQAARAYAASAQEHVTQEFGAQCAAAFKQAVADVQSVSTLQSSPGALAILQAAAQDDALRVRLMYLHNTFRPEIAPEHENTRMLLRAAMRHIGEVVAIVSGESVSMDDVAAVVWYDRTGEQRAPLLEGGIPDEAQLDVVQQQIGRMYNVLNRSAEIQRAYYAALSAMSLYAAEFESDASENVELRTLASVLASYGYDDVSNAKNLARFFGIDSQVMEDGFSMDQSPRGPEAVIEPVDVGNSPVPNPYESDQTHDYEYAGADEVPPLGEIDVIGQSFVWLAVHPAWRGSEDQQQFTAELIAHAVQEYGEEFVPLLAGLASKLQAEAPRVSSTDKMQAVLRLAAADDALRVLFMFLSSFSPEALWGDRADRVVAAGLVLQVASRIRDARDRPVSPRDVVRVIWPYITENELRLFERVLSKDPDVQRHMRAAGRMYAALTDAGNPQNREAYFESMEMASRSASSGAVHQRSVVLRTLARLQPPAPFEAAPRPKAAAPNAEQQPAHEMASRSGGSGDAAPGLQTPASNVEQQPTDAAYEILVANISQDDSQTLTAWAAHASLQPHFTPPSSADRAALQRVVDALAKVPDGTSSQDRYSALVRLSVLDAGDRGPRDPRHVIIDMIIGSGKSAEVAWLLHQAKRFFPNQPADVWEHCRTLVDTFLDKNANWKTAADLVGAQTIRKYFSVCDEDRPRNIQPRSMAKIVRSLLVRSIKSQADRPSAIQPLLQLSEQIRAAAASPEHAQAVQSSLTEVAQTFEGVRGARKAIYQLVTGERTPQKSKDNAALRSQTAAHTSQSPPQPEWQPMAPRTGTKTSTLTPNARATALLSWLVPSFTRYIVNPVTFYGYADVQPHHFNKDYEVIEWCTKPLGRLERVFGATPQHYVLLKERNNDNAPLEAFPADMFTVHAHVMQPVTEGEVVRFASSATGPFIVRPPGPRTQRAAARNAGPPSPLSAAFKHVGNGNSREFRLLSQAFLAARAVKPDYDLENAGQLHNITGTEFRRFCYEIAKIVPVPNILPRALQLRLLMRRARQHISALVRHEERILARPFLDSLPEYDGAVKRRWNAKKHPAEIKTGDILGTKNGHVILRVGDTAHIAEATDFLRQCRFTGVLAENLHASNLPVKVGKATALRIQFKKNPEGTGFFIYTPQVDGFVRGYSTPNKRIRMVLQDLPVFKSMPARFHEWPNGSKAMLAGAKSPFLVKAKFRHDHKDYVVAFNQKSHQFEAFDGRYLLDELARTAKLEPEQQRLTQDTRVYFERDPSGRIRLQRAQAAQAPPLEPNAAALALTKLLPPKGELCFPKFKEEPPPGLCMVVSKGYHSENVVLVYHKTGREVEVPAAYFIKQHLERGGLVQVPLKPNAKLTLTQTNGHVTVTGWHPGLLPDHAVPKALKRLQELAP